MFSKTTLGIMIKKILQGEFKISLGYDSVLMILSLLLADLEIYKDNASFLRVIDWLSLLYGFNGSLKQVEKFTDEDVILFLRNEVIKDDKIINSPKTMAYLIGLLGDDYDYTKNDSVCNNIYRRQLRIFHGYSIFSSSITNTNIKPIVLVGLKGAGKSYILNELERRGEVVHEIYKVFDEVKINRPDLLFNLPNSNKWESELMEIGFKYRGWTDSFPEKFFIGSVLRMSEFKKLSLLGMPKVIYIKSSNELRHGRIRKRGRIIEKNAHENWLIELDAHRGGEWPGYENNDVSSLISLAGLVVENNEVMLVDEMVESIINYILNKK